MHEQITRLNNQFHGENQNENLELFLIIEDQFPRAILELPYILANRLKD